MPVGGDEPSVAELERYVRRVHLDLTSTAPDDATIADGRARLETEGNTPATRAAIADELIEADAWAETFVAELENRVFAGETLDNRYQFICGIIRSSSQFPACNACAPSADPCADCSCPQLTLLFDERAELRQSAADLASNELSTGEVERAWAGSQIYASTFGDAATLAGSLFDNFLHRPAEPEELTNATNMVNGSLLGPEFPAGLLFHRHGSNRADLVDIMFSDEAYREAAVAAVFDRYLGRAPTPDELAHFVAELDADTPDVRPVVRAIVSSREYFEQ